MTMFKREDFDMISESFCNTFQRESFHRFEFATVQATAGSACKFRNKISCFRFLRFSYIVNRIQLHY